MAGFAMKIMAALSAWLTHSTPGLQGSTSSSNLGDVQRILQAAHFAAGKHANQKRKGIAGEPKINHLIEVAELVAGSLSESDTNLIIAALLHDVIEDTPTTKQDLTVLFGTDVAGLVGEVTDDKSLRKTERKRVQLETALRRESADGRSNGVSSGRQHIERIFPSAIRLRIQRQLGSLLLPLRSVSAHRWGLERYPQWLLYQSVKKPNPRTGS